MKRSRVPLREGMFTEDAKGVALLANRCKLCDRVFFPTRDRCFDCLSQDMEQLMLRGPCKLYTFTIVHMPAKHYAPPYAVSWVEFPEGVRVFGQIKGWEMQPMKIGMEMRLIIDTLWQDEEKEVIAYKFEPVFCYSKE